MNFAVFLVLNALLLIRPEELSESSGELRLYLVAITACTLLSVPRLLSLLAINSLAVRPVAVCVLLFLASTLASMTVRGRLGEALEDFVPEFAKVVLYYFLLLANVDSRARFDAFVGWLVGCIVVLAAIALAAQYELAHFPSIVPAIERYRDPADGSLHEIARMTSSGIFADPNDLCLILGFGICSCLYLATGGGLPGGRLWLLPIPLFGFAILETHSRGGLLGVLAGCLAYGYSRFGGPRAAPFLLAAGFLTLLAVGGRQGNIGGGGTAHERLMFWADGLTNLFNRPLLIPTGLGVNWFSEENGLVAHNSFVEAYVDLGLLGGGSFLGAFALAVGLVSRLGRRADTPRWTADARHYGFAAVVGYAGGCFSLTRNFVIPTYLVLGIASVLLEPAAETLPDRDRVNRGWFLRGAAYSALGLVALKFITQGLGLAGI